MPAASERCPRPTGCACRRAFRASQRAAAIVRRPLGDLRGEAVDRRTGAVRAHVSEIYRPRTGGRSAAFLLDRQRKQIDIELLHQLGRATWSLDQGEPRVAYLRRAKHCRAGCVEGVALDEVKSRWWLVRSP
jgi:hypothetical protein